jgi:predicted hydrocarbon binding protein
MSTTDHTSPAPATAEGGSITPLLPLILLETMRDMDRPEEVMEDEDVTVSLPRRLGLSDVVGVQIRRFQQEVRHKRLQQPTPMVDLLRLVIRRPDAEEIFYEAGARTARNFWEQRAGAMRRTINFLPRPLATVAANRAGKRMFRRLVGTPSFALQRWPIELRVEGSLTARADPGGAACAYYAGALAELMHLYLGRRYRVRHVQCSARGDRHCHWTVEVTA